MRTKLKGSDTSHDSFKEVCIILSMPLYAAEFQADALNKEWTRRVSVPAILVIAGIIPIAPLTQKYVNRRKGDVDKKLVFWKEKSKKKWTLRLLTHLEPWPSMVWLICTSQRYFQEYFWSYLRKTKKIEGLVCIILCTILYKLYNECIGFTFFLWFFKLLSFFRLLLAIFIHFWVSLTNSCFFS